MRDHRDRHAFRGDALAALLLGLLLTAIWTARDWTNLTALRLPDTDDVMRLQQIRDWISGQAFSDLSQHRLGAPPGLAMHWSRLPDLVPAAIVAVLTPLAGAHAAELTAVIAWPAMLLWVALFLVAGIARALGGDPIARTALVVAAIAYPATTLFLPGRIDHHGLQIVLLLIVVRAIVDPASSRSGVVAGLATAASLAIGLETAPLIAIAGLIVTVEWVRGTPRADDRMLGFGLASSAGLLVASIVLSTDQWAYPACDGFTASAWRAAQVTAAAPVVLAFMGRRISGAPGRTALALVTGSLVAGIAVMVSPSCLNPYGMVDPMLAKSWLAQVGEAQSMRDAPLATTIGYAGVMLAGIVATAWQANRTHDARWTALLAVQLAALALAAVQLRGAYAGAILAAPALAAVIAAARRRGTLSVAGAWIVSAGTLYPIAADALSPRSARQEPVESCTAPDVVAALAALPPGRLLAPIDLGAYAIGGTRHTVIAAPYHRNNAGNRAAYRFFLGSPDEARAIARRWEVDYVVSCPGRMAHTAWLVPIDHAVSASIYRVERDEPPLQGDAS